MEPTSAADPTIAALQSSVAKFAARQKSSRQLKYVLLVISLIQVASIPPMLLLRKSETMILGHAFSEGTAGSTPSQADVMPAASDTRSGFDPIASLLGLMPLLVLAGTASCAALAWRVESRAAREHRLALERLERELARRRPLPDAR